MVPINLSVLVKVAFRVIVFSMWFHFFYFVILHVDRVAGGVWSHDTFARQKVVGVHLGQASKVCAV